MPTFHKSNGDLTTYAFACGYMQSWTADGSDAYYGTDGDAVTLYQQGAGWSVRFRVNGEAHWHTFDSLTEARAFWSAVRTYLKAKAKVDALLTD